MTGEKAIAELKKWQKICERVIGSPSEKAIGCHLMQNLGELKAFCNEIIELEGLFRQIYRKDTRANKLNKQKQLNKFKKVRKNRMPTWK